MSIKLIILKSKNKQSALKEVEGISAINSVGLTAVSNFKKNRQKKVDIEVIFQNLQQGQIASLSQAITLIESTQSNHNQLANDIIQKCLPHANQSIRIGITGIPGVGKSTFIEAFGKYLTNQGKKVAVLAVDPTSTLSKGSILGDKTRMEELVKDPHAFIRPSPSGQTLGGVARKTRETIILCEAAGYDTILIETVGVGQSETAVHGMVDFFLLLKIAGAGDELQGIKRGIMEMADLIVINKADGENINQAKLAKAEFNRALHLFPMKNSEWTPKVQTCSALNGLGIEEIWETICEYIKMTKKNNYFDINRKEQNYQWMIDTINEQLLSNFFEHPQIKNQLPLIIDDVKKGIKSPFVAANYLLNLFK